MQTDSENWGDGEDDNEKKFQRSSSCEKCNNGSENGRLMKSHIKVFIGVFSVLIMENK